ncbi:MAG TPA: DUF47 family protein [Solirubrobacteraceae bacterium]|nr:DUF47 family protein [Solirubrobacteraceae bacterium]
MSSRRWFLPETPDVLGMLRAQSAITVEGIEALVAWAGGEEAAADRVRQCEHRADRAKRELATALSTAFTTPLEPEDLFELSRRLDEVLNSAKNTVREAEVMGIAPNGAIEDMVTALLEGTRHIAEAFAALDAPAGAVAPAGAEATAAADIAVKSQRRLEHIYRVAMSALIDEEDLHEVAGRRELYRRLSRMSDILVAVAERVWYAVLKEN